MSSPPPDYCLHCGLQPRRAGGCGECGPEAPGLQVALEPRCLPPGTTLYHGQYVIGRALGTGGFGVTYLGIDARLGMRLAIKELMPRSVVVRGGDGMQVAPLANKEAEFQRDLDRFLGEARMLVPFSEHPNIVSVKAFFEENGTAYLVMPYLDGVTLDEHLAARGGRLDEDEAVQIAVAVLDALRATHARDLLHRDIKPQNVFITADGMVKLIDFGSARRVAGAQDKLTAFVSEGYTPYEQYQSELRQGPPADIYAVGATLYRMLTGEEPPAAIGRMVRDPIVPPRAAVGAAVSARVSETVMRALEVKPEARFQSVAEMEAALTGRSSGLISNPAPSPAVSTPMAAPMAAPAVAVQAPRSPLHSPGAPPAAGSLPVTAPVTARAGGRGVLLVVAAVLALAGVAYAAISLSSDDDGGDDGEHGEREVGVRASEGAVDEHAQAAAAVAAEQPVAAQAAAAQPEPAAAADPGEAPAEEPAAGPDPLPDPVTPSAGASRAAPRASATRSAPTLGAKATRGAALEALDPWGAGPSDPKAGGSAATPSPAQSGTNAGIAIPKPAVPGAGGSPPKRFDLNTELRRELIACMEKHRARHLITRIRDGLAGPAPRFVGIQVVDYRAQTSLEQTKLGSCLLDGAAKVKQAARDCRCATSTRIERDGAMAFELRSGPLPDEMKGAADRIDADAAKQALAALDDGARACAEKHPDDSGFGDPKSPKGREVGLFVYFQGIDGKVGRVEPRFVGTDYRKCLAAVYGAASIPRFQSFEERIVHVFKP